MAGDEELSYRGTEEWSEESGRYVMSVAMSMTGVDAYRIRKYEVAGLVRPVRTAGGQRLFSDRDISRIREVAKLEEEGVNLKGIAVILGMRGSPRGEKEMGRPTELADIGEERESTNGGDERW
jgi:MerR family transcriptional regulator, heat shock protein HspR